VVPVDFSDVPGTGSPSTEYSEMTQGMDNFYKAISGGRVSFKFTILDKYIRVPSKSDQYGLGKWSGGDAGGYMKELISASDPTVDFSKFDVAYFLSPKSIPWSSIAYGPAFVNDLKTQDFQALMLIRIFLVLDGSGFLMKPGICLAYMICTQLIRNQLHMDLGI